MVEGEGRRRGELDRQQFSSGAPFSTKDMLNIHDSLSAGPKNEDL